MKKTWKVLLCMALIMTMLLGSVAMAAGVPSAADQAADENHHAIAGLEGLNNGRDLGGYYTADGQYRIKSGLLFRTAKLADCTEGDVALLQSLGIKKVIDLRMLTERLSKPDKTIPGADNIVISTQTIPNIFAITGEDWLMMLSAIKSGVMDTYMTGMYRQLISDPVAIKGTQKFFKQLIAANGGHEYPVLKTPDGDFSLFNDFHGLVVGGMDGTKYRDYELTLLPGAKLFVYTDGVPEATDTDGRFFGIDRLLDALNGSRDDGPAEILRDVRYSVDTFVGDAEQFDDLTMLCLVYNGPMSADT